MKSKVICFLLLTIAISSAFLRADPPGLDPATVKSKGAFNNVAPDSTQIITPAYAKPKIQVDLVRKDFGLATRTLHTGIIRQLGTANVLNPHTQTFEKTPVVHDTPLSVTSTNMAPITNVSQTQIDANTKKVIPWLDNRTAPKELHGTDPNAITQKQ